MDKAAAALEANSDEKGSRQEACDREYRKGGCWREGAEEASGGKKKCSYREEKPAEKKPTTEEKKTAA